MLSTNVALYKKVDKQNHIRRIHYEGPIDSRIIWGTIQRIVTMIVFGIVGKRVGKYAHKHLGDLQYGDAERNAGGYTIAESGERVVGVHDAVDEAVDGGEPVRGG